MHSSSPVLGTKLCRKCLSERPASEFFIRKYKATRFLHSYCKPCCAIKSKNWIRDNYDKARKRHRQTYDRLRRETPWINSYYGADQRCNNPNSVNYPPYGGRGIKFLMTKADFAFLWKRDNGHEMERPAIDRINPKGNYHIKNCRFIETFENSRRMGKLKPVQVNRIRQMASKGIKQEVISRKFGIGTAMVSMVSNRKRYGYI